MGGNMNLLDFQKKSSSINKAWYDQEYHLLIVEFSSEVQYVYFDVEPETIDLWLQASKTPKGSYGHWFYFNIREEYKYERLD